MNYLSRLLAHLSAATLVCAPNIRANATAPGSERALVELFTSQGCSSCPPADAVAGRLRTDPHVLVLSFHVNYWDGLGWKDPFASQASTDRQYAYAHSLRERSVFTPQLIVNGTKSLVGSREEAVRLAVADATQNAFPVRAELARQADGGFLLSLEGAADRAEVWEIRYVKYAATPIHAGENGGRTLETYNNVTRIQRLGAFAPGTLRVLPLEIPDDGLAVIVQASGEGKILGAAVY